jgi:DNA-directed RNA polymerase subunit K/omega
MSKKAPLKKNSKKEDSEDEYNDEDIDDVEEVEVDDFDDDDYDDDNDDDDDDYGEESEANKTIIEPETESGNCIIEEVIEEDIKYFDNDEVNKSAEQSLEYVSKEHRVSSNRLTKYEMVRILGERTKQLTTGAKPMVKNYKGLSYEKIAEEEFMKNMIPFKLKRPLPNGKFEIWTLDELSSNHLLSLLE